MKERERLVFRVKTGKKDATPYLDALKVRFPDWNESEILRYSLKVAAEA